MTRMETTRSGFRMLAMLVGMTMGAGGCGPVELETAREDDEAYSAADADDDTDDEALADDDAVAAPPGFDWGKGVVESTMQRFPTAAALGPWEYSRALFLHGAYLVYKRLGDKRYLAYIRSWVDSHVDSDGKIDRNINSLDNMMPGNLLLDLYLETGVTKYRKAAERIRKRLDTYPRTTLDGPLGAFWHTTGKRGQLWADGTFMVLPFLARYGQIIGDTAYANDEVARQLVIYGSHLRGPNGLLFHAYAEKGDTQWADPVTHHSPEPWCRAIGWYGMATIHVLDALPAQHPQRARIVGELQSLVAAFERYQDASSGRWFQVVDKGALSKNWLETSCSSMYTFVIASAVTRGHVPPSHRAAALKGYQGVLKKASLGSDGRTNIKDVCIGTDVGVLSYYLSRPRRTNDFHGLGAFLIMNEQLRAF